MRASHCFVMRICSVLACLLQGQCCQSGAQAPCSCLLGRQDPGTSIRSMGGLHFPQGLSSRQGHQGAGLLEQQGSCRSLCCLEGICSREAAVEGEAATCSRVLDALQHAVCFLWMVGWSSTCTGEEAGCAQGSRIFHDQVSICLSRLLWNAESWALHLLMIMSPHTQIADSEVHMNGAGLVSRHAT